MPEITMPEFPATRVNLMLMSPGDAGADGQGLVLRYGLVASPFGQCFLVFSPSAIVYLGFPSLAQLAPLLAQLQASWPRALICEDVASATALATTVFGNTLSLLNVLAKGTPFQQQVWQALLAIPRGESCSYADIARRINRPQACRAVGSAVGKNPVSYLLPCHRVLPQGGGVGQYMWGSALKRQMLAYERATSL